MSVEKQLDAAQKFLRGITSLTSYAEVREKQALGVQRSLEKVAAFSVAQAATWLGTLQEELWSNSQVETFREIVALKARPVEADSGLLRGGQRCLVGAPRLESKVLGARSPPRQQVADDLSMALFAATKRKERVSLVQNLRCASTRSTALLTGSWPARIRSCILQDLVLYFFEVCCVCGCLQTSADVCGQKAEFMLSAEVVCGFARKASLWTWICCLRVSTQQESWANGHGSTSALSADVGRVFKLSFAQCLRR